MVLIWSFIFQSHQQGEGHSVAERLQDHVEAMDTHVVKVFNNISAYQSKTGFLGSDSNLTHAYRVDNQIYARTRF